MFSFWCVCVFSSLSSSSNQKAGSRYAMLVGWGPFLSLRRTSIRKNQGHPIKFRNLRLRTMYVRTCLGTFQYFDRLNGKFVEDTRIFVSYLGLLRKPVDWTIYFHAPYSTCICVKANNRLAQPAIPVPSERPIVQQTPKKKKATHQANSYQSAALLFWGGALSLSLSLI